MKVKTTMLKRSITTSRSKKRVLRTLKNVGVTNYSLKQISKGRIKITLKSNLETCRRILQILEE